MVDTRTSHLAETTLSALRKSADRLPSLSSLSKPINSADMLQVWEATMDRPSVHSPIKNKERFTQSIDMLGKEDISSTKAKDLVEQVCIVLQLLMQR